MYQWVINQCKAHYDVLKNGSSLIGTMFVTSGFGFVFWSLAAHRLAPQAVGLASAEISVMTLLGAFAVLGLGTLLLTELPRMAEGGVALVRVALALVGAVGLMLGLMYALVAPLFLPTFQLLHQNILHVLLFALGVALTAMTLFLDRALIGLFRAGLQFWRNVVAALTKLAMLVMMALWLLHPDSLLIYISWALGNACSLLIIVPLLLRQSRSRSLVNCWHFFAKRCGPSLTHHILNLSLDAPSQIMPVLVTVLLSATSNAWFAMSSLLSNFVFGALVALTIVLCATGSARPAEMTAKIRFSLSISLLICGSANLIFLLAASRLLALFGPGYAVQARWCLQLLGLGTFPCIIRSHYVAIHRIRGTMATAITPIIVSGVFELASAALGARLAGLTGLSLGLLLAYCVEAVWISRTVYAAIVPVQKPVTTMKPELIPFSGAGLSH